MQVCPRPQQIEGPVGAHVELPGRVKYPHWSKIPSRSSPLFTAVHSLLLKSDTLLGHSCGRRRQNKRSAWWCRSQLIASQRHVGVLDLYGFALFWGKNLASEGFES